MEETLDLSGFVTDDNATSGVWFELELDGRRTGAEIKVLGADCEKVALYSKRAERKLTKMLGSALGINKTKTDDNDDFDEEKAKIELNDKIEGAVVRIAGIRKKGGGDVIVNGKQIAQDEESFRYFCRKIPATIDFVNKKSAERSNFLANRSED